MYGALSRNDDSIISSSWEKSIHSMNGTRFEASVENRWFCLFHQPKNHFLNCPVNNFTYFVHGGALSSVTQAVLT